MNQLLVALSTTLCIAIQNLSKGVNVVSKGVRVSGGHLCEAKAPTEAAAETTLTNLHGAPNLLRNHNSAQIVDSTNYSCCFHIFTPFLYSEMCQKPSIYAGFRDLLVYSNYTSPKPILPLFSFVPVGHKGLEDLGRVVVFCSLLVSHFL